MRLVRARVQNFRSIRTPPPAPSLATSLDTSGRSSAGGATTGADDRASVVVSVDLKNSLAAKVRGSDCSNGAESLLGGHWTWSFHVATRP